MMGKKDFEKMKKSIAGIVDQGIDDHDEYVDNEKSPTADDSETLLRNIFKDVIEGIKEFLINEYDFYEGDFDHFPELDQLLWHEDGWNLKDAIIQRYKKYNQTRNKALLKLKIRDIIKTESDRLCNTVYDEANYNNERFPYVEIGGENGCGGCGDDYGVHKCRNRDYILPPYHPDCHCWAVWFG